MLFNEYKLEIEEYEEKILNFRALPEFWEVGGSGVS